MNQKIGQLGRSQLVKNVEEFCQRFNSFRRHMGVRRALEKDRLAKLETALALMIDDVASIMGLPPNSALVTACVLNIFARQQPEEEEEFHSYFGSDW
jgi:hypothetical protein